MAGNSDEIYAALTEIFNEVFMRDDMVLSAALSAKDVQGWDSFKQIEIMVTVEEKFGVKFNTREIESLRSIGDLAALVIAKTNS